MAQLRLSTQSALRQTFVRKCQFMGNGHIVRLVVREAQPVFAEHTEVLVDLKLDADESPRAEQHLVDYVLRSRNSTTVRRT